MKDKLDFGESNYVDDSIQVIKSLKTKIESKYLQAQAARLFYAAHNTGAQWGQVGESFREPYEKSARGA